jgi:hypothetical protein
LPRSRALRIIGGALLSASVPLARPGLRPAGAASFRANSCSDPGTCANPAFPKVCGCNFLAGCYRDCCGPSDVCGIFPPSSTGTGPPCEKGAALRAAGSRLRSPPARRRSSADRRGGQQIGLARSSIARSSGRCAALHACEVISRWRSPRSALTLRARTATNRFFIAAPQLPCGS